MRCYVAVIWNMPLIWSYLIWSWDMVLSSHQLLHTSAHTGSWQTQLCHQQLQAGHEQLRHIPSYVYVSNLASSEMHLSMSCSTSLLWYGGDLTNLWPVHRAKYLVKFSELAWASHPFKFFIALTVCIHYIVHKYITLRFSVIYHHTQSHPLSLHCWSSTVNSLDTQLLLTVCAFVEQDL